MIDFLLDSFTENSFHHRFIYYLLNLFGYRKNHTSIMEQKHNDRIISMTYQHAWHVITRRIKINHNNDIQRNVLESDLVVKAIEEVASTHLYRHHHHHHHHHHNHQESDRIRLTSSIETSATRLSKEYLHLLQRYRHKATQHLERIRSCVSSSLLRISGWILYRLLCKLFVAVQFNTNQINYIRNRQRENIPIIYLLRHRSYLDYLLISFILSMNDLNPPLIALDENRFAPFVGNLIRGLGAYFFSHKKNDPLYSAVMRSYIEENLRKGNSMEFHLKSSHNQTEFRLLSIILDIMDSGSAQQVLIVPIKISYEKIIEQQIYGYNRNDCFDHQKYSFLETIKTIWSVLNANYGTVHVDFGCPFALKDFLKEFIAKFRTEFNFSIPTLKDFRKSNSFDIDIETRTDLNQKKSIETLCIDQKWFCLKALDKYIRFQDFQDCSILPTYLVSFLLLNQYKNNRTTIDQLCVDIDWFRRSLGRDRQINFRFATTKITRTVRKAIKLIGKDLIQWRKIRIKLSSTNEDDHLDDDLVSENWFKLTQDDSWISYEERKIFFENLETHRKYQENHNDSDEFDFDQNLERNGNKISLQSSYVELVRVNPSRTSNSLIKLQYFADNVGILLRIEAVLAISLGAFFQNDFSMIELDRSTFISKRSVNKSEFLNRCRFICFVLNEQFIFSKNFNQLDRILQLTFEESFVKQDLFVLNPRKPSNLTSLVSFDCDRNYHQCYHRRENSQRISLYRSLRKRSNCFFKHMDKTLQNEYILEVDEDIANTNNIEENNNTNEMEEFHLRLTERNCQLLKLYHSILYPHLEAYYLIIEKLSLLCEKERFDTTFDGKVSSPINNPIVNIAKLEQIICETIPLDRFGLFSTTMITNVLEFLIKTSSIKMFEDIKLNQNDQKDLDAVDLVDHLVFEPNPIVANHCESFDNSSSSSSSTTISLNLIEKDPIDQSSIKCMLSRERLSTMALSIKPFMIR